jgi:hypothetical protein
MFEAFFANRYREGEMIHRRVFLLILAALTEPGLRAGTIEFDFTATIQSVTNNLSPTGIFAQLGAYTFLSDAHVGDSVSGSFIFTLDSVAYDPAGEFISGGYQYGTGYGSVPFVVGSTSVTDGPNTLSSTSPDVWQLTNFTSSSGTICSDIFAGSAVNGIVVGGFNFNTFNHSACPANDPTQPYSANDGGLGTGRITMALLGTQPESGSVTFFVDSVQRVSTGPIAIVNIDAAAPEPAGWAPCGVALLLLASRMKLTAWRAAQYRRRSL